VGPVKKCWKDFGAGKMSEQLGDWRTVLRVKDINTSIYLV